MGARANLRSIPDPILQARPPVPHGSVPARQARSCTKEAGLGQVLELWAAPWHMEPAVVSRPECHFTVPCASASARDQLSAVVLFSRSLGGRVGAVGAFKILLFCFCKLFPWYHGKDLLITTLWVAVSKV